MSAVFHLKKDYIRSLTSVIRSRFYFFPDGIVWQRRQNGFLCLAQVYNLFVYEATYKLSLLCAIHPSTLNRLIQLFKNPVCFVFPLFYKCWLGRDNVGSPRSLHFKRLVVLVWNWLLSHSSQTQHYFGKFFGITVE